MTTLPHGISQFLDTLAGSEPASVYHAYAGICRLHLYYDLMTVLAYDEADQSCVRVYSSRPEQYPLDWHGQLNSTGWGEAVLRDGKIWHGPNAAAIRSAFNDADRILASGCKTCLSIPTRWNRRTLGAVSFLGNQLRFDDNQIVLLRLFTSLLAAPLLARQQEGAP